MSWTFDNIPDQTGRTAIITGANTGLGFETARMLAQRGAHVVLACRNLGKGSEALRRILEFRPSGSVTLESLDLSDLGSIASFAQKTLATQPRIDLLINNAGVMVPPRGKTAQGFELQFGTNHLGHFALTAPLLPRLARQPAWSWWPAWRSGSGASRWTTPTGSTGATTAGWPTGRASWPT